ncbi:MAG: hypothetical protein J7L94_01660, partial [Caldisericaceae bacterium]|nr:hypothetical protein [Caldisericaceae bacterium]
GQSFTQIALDNYVIDPDNADNEIDWTYSGNQDLIVTIDANRVAIISPPDSNWNGAETITFTATDPGGLSDSDTATFTVNPVEDSPVFNGQPQSLSFFEDDSLFVPFSYWYPFVNDPDTPDSALHYQLNSTENIHVANRSVGTLIFADANWFGSDSLLLTVDDSTNSDSVRVAVAVLPLNDPPQIFDFPDTLSFYKGDSLKLLLTSFAKDIDTPIEKLYWKYNVNDFLILCSTIQQLSSSPFFLILFPGNNGCLPNFLTIAAPSILIVLWSLLKTP